MIIKQNTDAAKVIVEVKNKHIGSAIKAIGPIVNDIAIEYPLVSSPDVNDDADWSPMMMDGDAVVINGDNSMWVINGTLGKIRINKPAGDNVGISHDW